jgi:hypothetical protein
MRWLLGLPGWLGRPIARALVVALSVSALGPILHDLHAEACEPALVLHDAGQHRFSSAATAPGQSSAPDHCLACHLQRAARGPAAAKSPAPQATDTGRVLRPADWTFVADPASLPLPARAPPAAA